MTNSAAVLTRDRARGVAEQAVYGLDRAAGDDGQRAVQRITQSDEHCCQAWWDDHGVRCGREIDQCAIHIEQQGGAMKWWQRVHRYVQPVTRRS